MLFHFRTKFPQLNVYWDRYLEFQKRLDIPAKTILLEEGEKSQNYIFIEKGCVRSFFNNNGEDKTVQFFFENEGLILLIVLLMMYQVSLPLKRLRPPLSIYCLKNTLRN